VKTESLREVKNNLSRVIEGLRRTGPVLITKNGRSRAVLIDRSVAGSKRRGPTRLEDLPE